MFYKKSKFLHAFSVFSHKTNQKRQQNACFVYTVLRYTTYLQKVSKKIQKGLYKQIVNGYNNKHEIEQTL